jgi:site-specific DNA-methyltransferase (adenine-specific)
MKPYYSDDLVTIYHGDCREMLASIEADVIVTDPPYGIGWGLHGKGRKGKMRGSRLHPGIVGDTDTSMRDGVLDWWGDRPAVVFGTWRSEKPARTYQALVFQKTLDTGIVGSTTGYRNDWEMVFLTGRWPVRNAAWSGVLRSAVALNSRGGIQDIGHPHAKPLDVMVPLVDRCPLGVVFDPFAGSGSTLVAAKSLGRRAIGIEIEERYAEIAANRCRQEVLLLGNIEDGMVKSDHAKMDYSQGTLLVEGDPS